MNSLLEGIRLQVCKGPKAQSWLLTCLLPTNFLAWGVGSQEVWSMAVCFSGCPADSSAE